MLKFILKDKPIQADLEGVEVEIWQVVQVIPQPSTIVAEFIGSNDEKYLDKEIAPLMAGDYVEFLNEKYVDKKINQEWPAQDKKARLKYHLKRASEYADELSKE